MRMLTQDQEKDVQVTWEDQQRISTFSMYNTRLQRITDQLEKTKLEKEALDDVSMDIELADDDKPVLYRVGEAFVHLPLEKAQERLASDQDRVQAELSRLQDAAEECKSVMQDLKVHLYSKFGSSINLD